MALIDDPAVAAAIAQLLDEATPFTPEQEERLTSLLAPATREPVEEETFPEAA